MAPQFRAPTTTLLGRCLPVTGATYPILPTGATSARMPRRMRGGVVSSPLHRHCSQPRFRVEYRTIYLAKSTTPANYEVNVNERAIAFDYTTAWPTAPPAPRSASSKTPHSPSSHATPPVEPRTAGQKLTTLRHADHLRRRLQEHQPAHQVAARSITLPDLVLRVRQPRPGFTTLLLTPGLQARRYRSPRG